MMSGADSACCGRLGDDVGEHPARRAGRTRREPGRRRQRPVVVEVDGPDQLVGRRRDRGIRLQDAREGLALQQTEAVGVVGVVAVARDGRRPVDDEVGPALLGLGDVLDDATEGQLTDGGPLRRLPSVSPPTVWRRK